MYPLFTSYFEGSIPFQRCSMFTPALVLSEARVSHMQGKFLTLYFSVFYYFVLLSGIAQENILLLDTCYCFKIRNIAVIL